ncbi:MAG: hypothetical protein JXB85_13045 [Anaerolineales bacterium]|nr:hypothetical protein [Anaerolineales bacterium]
MPSFTAYNILEVCRQPGCPVCRLEQRYVERYLDNQFYENVNNPDWRNLLRLSLGFCREHAWLAVDERLGDALGFAIIYHDAIGATLECLDKGFPPPTRRWAGRLKRIPEQVRAMVYRAIYALTPRKRCPACQKRDEMTSIIVSSLVESLEQQEMAEALQASDGLCLPHLRLALQAVRDIPSCEMLIAIHRRKLETLQAELAELIRKHDYRFSKDGFGKEGDSWLRAVAMMAGNPKSRQ